MNVKPEAYQAHYRRISASRAADKQAQELAVALNKQFKQKEMEEVKKARKQAAYENRQYAKLLARHPPPPPPPPPSTSLAYNWRANCSPDGPPLDEDEYQPKYVDPCDPQYKCEKQPLSAPAFVSVTSKKMAMQAPRGEVQIGYDETSSSVLDVEMGC